jgi:hypothetical protein
MGVRQSFARLLGIGFRPFPCQSGTFIRAENRIHVVEIAMIGHFVGLLDLEVHPEMTHGPVKQPEMPI